MAPTQQQSRKSVVITGATSGLGFGCAKALLRSNPSWHVVLASHNEQRTAEAARRLRSETGSTLATALKLDLASLDSVRTFARRLCQQIDSRKIPPLHAVVCNAATQHVSGTVYTDDGFEATYAVNHLSHFLLVNLLISRIRSPGRFVFLAGAGSQGMGFWERALGMAPPRTDFENLRELAVPEDDSDADPGWVGSQRYATSKLANVLTAYELGHRLRSASLSSPDAPITSNVFSPGLMPGTGLARDYGRIEQFLWNAVLPVFRVLPAVRSPDESGRDLARLVTGPDFENVSGQFIDGREISHTHPASYDEKLRRTLWKESAALVGLEGNSIGNVEGRDMAPRNAENG